MSNFNRVVSIIIFSTSLIPGSYSIGAEVLLNQTLGLVDQQAVSQRDVLLSHYFDAALDSKKPSTLSTQDLAKELNNLLVELMVDKETPGGQSQEADVKKSSDIWSRTKSDSFLQKLSVKEKEAEAITLRKQRVQAFMDLKISSLVSTPTEDEMKKYYDANKSKFGDVPFEKVSDNIKNFLIQTQRDSKLKGWFEALRKKYRAQNYIAEKETVKK